MHEYPSDVVSRILACMEIKGIDRDQLVRMGVASRNCLSQIFTRKRNPDPITVAKLAEALGVSVFHLINTPADDPGSNSSPRP